MSFATWVNNSQYASCYPLCWRQVADLSLCWQFVTVYVTFCYRRHNSDWEMVIPWMFWKESCPINQSWLRCAGRQRVFEKKSRECGLQALWMYNPLRLDTIIYGWNNHSLRDAVSEIRHFNQTHDRTILAFYSLWQG